MAAHDWRYGMSGPAPTMVARDLDEVVHIIGRPPTLDDPTSLGLAMLALLPLVGFTQLFN